MRIERLLIAALLGLGLCACQRVSKPEVDAQIQQLEAQRMASEARSRRLSRAASGFGDAGFQVIGDTDGGGAHEKLRDRIKTTSM